MKRLNQLASARYDHSSKRIHRRLNTNTKSFGENLYFNKFVNIYESWADTWNDVFTNKSFFGELLAGLTVAAVALPLNLALAVASGLPPSYGLIAGAIGGIFASIFGGASLQITGPAAALNLMVLSIVTTFGAEGASAGALIIGVMQLILALFFAGNLMKYVPEALLAGFLSGVGLKLLDNQIPELLGFNYKVVELAQMLHRPDWLKEVSWLSVVCGLFVSFLVITTKNFKRFPAALAGIGLVAFIANYLGWDIEKVGKIEVNSLSLMIPQYDLKKWFELFVACLPLGILAAAESLLSASAIDKLAGNKKLHNPNLELYGQSFGNLASGLVGGMPVSGVIVRSSVNIQSGGKTKVSAIFHSAILLYAVFYLSDKIESIPLAGLAGLLCVVGFRLIDFHECFSLMKKSKLELLAFLCAMLGTVSGFLMSGLVAGGLIFYFKNLFSKRKIKRITKKKNQVHLHQPIEAKKVKELKKEKFKVTSADDEELNWLGQIKQRAQVAASAFVHNQASVIGKVVLGDNVHIAAGSSVRADEGTPFYIGDNSNIQDGVVIHALKGKWINVNGEEWAVYVGKNVSMAHQALVHGPCFIGDNSFIGFKAVVHDSIVGSHCFIGIGAVVVGVEIPDEKHVPNGSVIDSQEKVDQLPDVSDHHLHFNEDVVDVNKGLAKAYLDLFNPEDEVIPPYEKKKVINNLRSNF